MRVIVLAPDPAAHRLPSGPTVIPYGPDVTGIRSVSGTSAPGGAMWPIWLVPLVVNHSFPSGPLTIPAGCGFDPGWTVNSWMSLDWVAFVASTPMCPVLPPYSVNQSRPSGPAAMVSGPRPMNGRAISTASEPDVAVAGIRPIKPPFPMSVNQRFPSGPVVMPTG